MSESSTSAPGLSISALLAQAKEPALRDLVGASVIDVLNLLDPDLTRGPALRTLATRLIDPAPAMREPAIRDKLLDLLPLAKARELARPPVQRYARRNTGGCVMGDTLTTADFAAARGPFHDLGLHVGNLTSRIHAANQRWWVDLNTGEPVQRNVGELLMLIVSELAEAMEGHRKSLPDDKLPHRPMIEVELADALIRICDAAAGLGLDLGGAVAEKMAFNAVREDHQREARLAQHGKKY